MLFICLFSTRGAVTLQVNVSMYNSVIAANGKRAFGPRDLMWSRSPPEQVLVEVDIAGVTNYCRASTHTTVCVNQRSLRCSGKPSSSLHFSPEWTSISLLSLTCLC